MTEDWRQFTDQRATKWHAEREKLVQIHREDTFSRLGYFYNTIKELYAGADIVMCATLNTSVYTLFLFVPAQVGTLVELVSWPVRCNQGHSVPL